MSKGLENAYFRSPLWLQNAAVSMMGLKLYRERYGKCAVNYEKELEESANFSGEQLRELQSRKFVQIARAAISHAPHYSEWARSIGLSERDIRSIDDLQLFPVLSKEQVRSAPERFVIGGAQAAKKLVKFHTSGTTGSPLTVYCSKEDRTKHYAFFSRLRKSFGLERRSRRATLFGRIIMLSDQNSPPFWRYDAVGRNLLMSSYHLGEENLEHYYNKLKNYQAAEIFAYPSSIVPIAQYILENDLPKLSLQLLMTTAEPLYPYQLDIVKRAFDAPVVNQYGCTEMAFFAFQPDGGAMKLAPEHGAAEVLLPSGEICASGEGEFIATGLINRSMPLIRYCVGDTVSVSPLKMDFRGESAYSEINSFTGRSDDLLYKKDGTPVGRLDPVFKGEFNIKAAQIIQLESGDINLFLEPDRGYSEKNGNALKQALEKRMGSDVDISIFTDRKIEKMVNGKFKAVHSAYANGAK